MPKIFVKLAVDEASQARSVLGGVVEHELEPRRVPQPQAPAELAAQEAGGVRQARCAPPRAGCVDAKG